MATKTNKSSKLKKCILANKKYGLFYGEVESFDPVTRVARVLNCRHVCRWFGKGGGITSLAAYGLCGSRANESRIGAAAGDCTLTGIVNVFECSAKAIKTIEDAGSKNEK